MKFMAAHLKNCRKEIAAGKILMINVYKRMPKKTKKAKIYTTSIDTMT